MNNGKWIVAQFKNQKVWISQNSWSCGEQLIPMKYGKDQERIYTANRRNVEVPKNKETKQPTSTKKEKKTKKTVSNSGSVGQAGKRTEQQKKEVRRRAAELMKTFQPQDIICFTDGSCEGNPGLCGSGAIVRFGNKNIIKESYRGLGEGTNNIAELYAIHLALDIITQNETHLEENSKIRIMTDSKYTVGSLTLNWKPKKNKQLIKWIKKKLSDRCRTHAVHIYWVGAHSGISENERADALANKGTRESKTLGVICDVTVEPAVGCERISDFEASQTRNKRKRSPSPVRQVKKRKFGKKTPEKKKVAVPVPTGQDEDSSSEEEDSTSISSSSEEEETDELLVLPAVPVLTISQRVGAIMRKVMDAKRNKLISDHDCKIVMNFFKKTENHDMMYSFWDHAPTADLKTNVENLVALGS